MSEYKAKAWAKRQSENNKRYEENYSKIDWSNGKKRLRLNKKIILK